MEISKSVEDDKENKAKDVTDSHFSMEERNQRSNKTFENSVTDIDKHGQQSRITNDFRGPYDSREFQNSTMDPSKCVAEEFDPIPTSSNIKNRNYTDVCNKHHELPNVSASNLDTIGSTESTTSSSVGFKKEESALLALSYMANKSKQPSISLESRFYSVIDNMPEMPKMKTSPEKAQSSKSKPSRRVRKFSELVEILETYYKNDDYPSSNVQQSTAIEIGLDVSSVISWFKGRRQKERNENELRKMKNVVVHLLKKDQSSNVQKVSTPIVNDENNRQFQVNPMNTTELGNRTNGNSSTCTVENVTAPKNTDKWDNPKVCLKSNEHFAATSSTAEVVTIKEKSPSLLREKLCTDQESPLDLSMPRRPGMKFK